MLRRVAVPAQVQNRSDVHTFPAATRGWVTNENIALAGPAAAKVLDNFVAEESSLRIRGGNLKWATVGSSIPCEDLMAYHSGTLNELFAATATDIFDITNPASPTAIPTASVTDQSNGNYSSVNMSTAGGEFLLAVNGEDRMLMYDGADWRRIDTATTELAYDAQSGAFTEGLVVTGTNSSAFGTIVEDLNNGTTGTLRLKDVTGTFTEDEPLTDTSTGAATSNIPSGTVAVPAITGAVTTDFDDIWLFKSRLFAIKKNTLIAYYLPVDSIGGAVGTISLQGIFHHGGSLMFGATWSTDAGDGKDDMCVFVSTKGEIAIYQGNDPSSVTDWQIVGVYSAAPPIHKKAYEKAGGNLIIATEDGLIPISSTLQRDKAALQLDAISRPIEPTWRSYVAARPGKWVVQKWIAKNYAIIGFPADGSGLFDNFTVNLKTGAWSRFTGWNIRCAIEFEGDLYLGTSLGIVTQAEGLGSDDGEIYTCTYVGLHEKLGNVAQDKTAQMARATWLSSTNFNFNMGFAFNYTVELGAWPAAPAESINSLWDTGLWDVAVWDEGGIQSVSTDWKSVAGHGFVCSPVVQVTMGADTIPDISLVSVDLLYEGGGIVV